MPDATDCLPATDPFGFLPATIAVLLMLVGLAAVLVVGRRARRGGVALGIVLLLGLGATGLGVGAAPVRADDACPTIGADADVTFDSGAVAFAGSFRGPIDPSRPVPAAVIVVGTGAVDRDGNGAGITMDEYAWLADLLAEQGVASLRYDKLGVGATGLGPFAADPAELSLLSYDELRVQPVRDALAFVAAQPGVDPSRLILIGHSEGGAVATQVATDSGDGPAIAGLVLVEPAYTRILDILARQFGQQIEAAVAGDAMTADDAAALTSWMRAGIADIRSRSAPFPDAGPPPLPEATDYTATMQAAIGGNIYGTDPTQMVVSHAYRTRYGKEFDEIDPAALAPEVRVPVLITCGTKDFNTPCGDGSPGSGVVAFAGEFEAGIARFVVLPDVVHILRDVGDAEVPALGDQVDHPFSSKLSAEFRAFVAGIRDGGAAG